MRKAVIFDFDGTLTKSSKINLSLMNEHARDFNSKFKSLNEKELESLRELPLKKMFERFGISDLQRPSFIQRLRKEFQAHMPDFKAVPGVKKILGDLKRKGVFISIITSNSEENARLFLSNTGLKSYIEKVIVGEVFEKDVVMTNLLNDERIDLKNAVYVGDEIRDIEAARKAGISIISVSWGLNSVSALAKYKPDALVNNPEELAIAIKKVIKLD